MDSGKAKQSPAAEIKMLCTTCKAPMQWRQHRRAWYCTGNGCGRHVTSGMVFQDSDANFLLECGIPLEKLQLRASIVALTKAVAKTTWELNEAGVRVEVKHFYVVLPYELPASYRVPDEMDWDADKQLRQLIGEKPWSKREAA